MIEQIQELSVDLIDDPLNPMRSEISAESIEDLARDIKKHGLIQPITVRPRGERFEVVAGHRRLVAVKFAALPVIRAIVVELGDEEADAVKIRENLYREDINPVEWAKHIDYLVKRYEYSPAQLAELLGKSEAFLRSRYDVLTYPDYLQDALAKEQISLTAAGWLARIEDDRVLRDYVRFAILGGLTARRAEAWYQSWKAGHLPRDPKTFQAPESDGAPAEQKIHMPCVICQVADDIDNMGMHYAHQTCQDAVKQ